MGAAGRRGGVAPQAEALQLSGRGPKGTAERLEVSP